MNSRDYRSAIARNTLETLEQGYYHAPSGQRIDIGAALAHARANTRHYTGEQLQQLPVQDPPQPRYATTIEVRNESTLAAARRLHQSGHEHVLCLNFASARNPGGGFLNGAEAQEENLAKSSGLYACIIEQTAYYTANRAHSFCGYLDDMIYSPAVPVFRDDEYAYLEQAFPVAIVTAPAANRGAIERNTPERLHELESIMLRRIDKLLSLARHHGHQTLVLGAWGCGVFGNIPAEMAAWFSQQLQSERHAGAFRHVCFAVLDPKDNGTCAAFRSQFGA